MYDRLDQVPVLDSYPSRIPAPVWNAWRRYRGRLNGRIRIGLEGLAPLALLIEEEAWAVVDTSLYDLPVVAWLDFREESGRGLHEPVPCTVRQYHQGAAKIRNHALERLQRELETRLKRQ